MKQQEIRDAYVTMEPLPGGEERMWRMIDQRLNGRGKERQIRFGKRNRSVPAFFAAAALLALVLLGVLSWQRRAVEAPREIISAATPAPSETPVPTPQHPLEESYRAVLDAYYMVLSERIDGSLCVELGISDLCLPYIRAAEENDPLDELGYAFLEMPDSQGWAMAIMPIHGPSYEVYALYVLGGEDEQNGGPVKVLDAREGDRFSTLLWEDGLNLLEREENGTGGEYRLWHLYNGELYLIEGMKLREENGERICVRYAGAYGDALETVTTEEAQAWLDQRWEALYRPRITPFRDYPNTSFYPGFPDPQWLREVEERLPGLEELDWTELETEEAMELLQLMQDYAGCGTAEDYVHILRAALHADGAYAEAFPLIFLSLYETDAEDFAAAFLQLTDAEQETLLPMLVEITGTTDPAVNRAFLWN